MCCLVTFFLSLFIYYFYFCAKVLDVQFSRLKTNKLKIQHIVQFERFYHQHKSSDRLLFLMLIVKPVTNSYFGLVLEVNAEDLSAGSREMYIRYFLAAGSRQWRR